MWSLYISSINNEVCRIYQFSHISSVQSHFYSRNTDESLYMLEFMSLKINNTRKNGKATDLSGIHASLFDLGTLLFEVTFFKVFLNAIKAISIIYII